ncbi:immunoglobulin superfamily member [Scyliorhinus canicula]|uniref:immunoglobulin superfamily member n=1 Tax=Scyliorhinus canicula TaxID=7830 RepID=UPI0018F3F24C|nr:immunoglobulin superfamily member [Scyliorhinus canicula]
MGFPASQNRLKSPNWPFLWDDETPEPKENVFVELQGVGDTPTFQSIIGKSDASIKTDHVAENGTTSVFIHLKTRHNETMANGRGNVTANTTLSLKTVATTSLWPIGNELLVSERIVESDAANVVERIITEEELSQQPSVDQGINKLKVGKGKSAVLPCWYHHDATYLGKISVSWYREDLTEKLPIVRDNTTVFGKYSGRVLLTGQLSNGDASITILNVTENDDGIYFCSVTFANGTTLNGDGTHLIVKSKTGAFGIKEMLGSTIGIVAASTVVLVGFMTIIVPRLREKMPCQKLDTRPAQVAPA